MLKRNSKAISLIVAVTAIVSAVPVMADDVKRIDVQEGNIETAKAYGNGIFIVDGYKTENDDTAIYYVTEDGKFNRVDGLDSKYDTFGDALLNQYAEIGNDGDIYLDLKNNLKIVDDDVRQTMVDDAARKLKNKIKGDNDGRLNKDYYQNESPVASSKRTGQTSTFLDGFAGTWSHYKYKLKDVLVSDKLNSNYESYTTIYSDLDGNYVDGNYDLGSLRVSTTSASVTINNTHDTYKIKDSGKNYELKAEIKENAFLSEGYSDMYRTADLKIYKKEEGADESTYKNVTSEISFGGSDNNHKITEVNNDGSITVFQKFSKTQASDSIDGIKYPQSSEIYFITDEDGNEDGLLGLSYTSKISGAGRGYGAILSGTKGMTSYYMDLTNQKIYAETFNLKQKDGYKYVDISDHDELDLDSASAKAQPSGSLWVVGDGYINMYDVTKKAFVKQYKVDHSMNEISMNGSNNIIVWNEDKGIYSIVYNKSAAGVNGSTTQNSTTSGNLAQNMITTGAAITVTNEATTGWLKNNDNTWSYIKNDGTKANGWIDDNEKWYYLKSNGVMSTGWTNYGNTWYYLDQSGTMQTGWINDNGNWYYCDASGSMLANTIVDGYILENDGAWIQ